jgi:hypothetical protein
MDTDLLISEAARQAASTVAEFSGVTLVLLLLYEWIAGRYKKPKKTREDWAMAAIALAFLAVVQRPLLTAFIFFSMTALFPAYGSALHWLEVRYFWPGLVVYVLIDEYLHGRTHLFSHSRKPRNKTLQKIQAFYKLAHRPHHQIGANDGNGELSVTQTYVEHWGWWLALPNYWFGLICLYLGFYEWFIWGTAGKAIWGMHVHTNWGCSYDLYLLNHKNALVRNAMYVLCHVFTFPNMHHHHHSRSANSAKNMCNMIAVYDWLLWDSLVIEKKRPAIYGWRQTPKEEYSPLYRFFNTDLSRM